MKKWRVSVNGGFVEFNNLLDADSFNVEFGIGDPVLEIEYTYTWNKNEHIESIDKEYTDYFIGEINKLNYLTIGELNLWLDDETYGNEATYLKNWWLESYKLLKLYFDSVTSETQKELFQIVPPLNPPTI